MQSHSPSSDDFRGLDRPVMSYESGHPLTRRRWLIVLIALAFTLATVSILPFADQLTPQPEPSLQLRTVDTTVWKVREPPEPARPVRQTHPPPEEKPMPRRPQFTAVPSPAVERESPDVPVIKVPRLHARPDFSLEFSQRASPVPSVATPPSPTPTVFQMSDLDQRPIPVLQRQPHYPFSARHRGIEGHVDVRFVVGVDGRVRDVRVVEGAPPEVFNEAALAAVRDWRFKPARVNDRNVAASMQVRIRFALER